MRLVIISILLVGLAFVLLGIKVLFVKGGKFPSGHIHSSKAMRDRGITCASHHADNKLNNNQHIH